MGGLVLEGGGEDSNTIKAIRTYHTINFQFIRKYMKTYKQLMFEVIGQSKNQPKNRVIFQWLRYCSPVPSSFYTKARFRFSPYFCLANFQLLAVLGIVLFFLDHQFISIQFHTNWEQENSFHYNFRVYQLSANSLQFDH